MHAVMTHASMLRSMVRRDLESRYKGTLLGRLWPILVQLAQLLIYLYVFAVVLGVRINLPGMPDNNFSFGLWLFAGLLPWYAFSNGLGQAATAVIRQPNLVKKVAFPLGLLPMVPVLVAFVEMLVGLAVLLVLLTAMTRTIHWQLLLLPAVWFCQLAWTLGLSFLAACLTVYIRDVVHIIGIGLQLGFFLTPIVYPASRVPAPFRRWLFTLNPFATLAECTRALVLFGTLEHWQEFLFSTAVGVVVFALGVFAYRRVRTGFADML